MFTRQNMGGGEAGQSIARIINASLTIPQSTLSAIKSMYGLNFKFTNQKGNFVGVDNFIRELSQIKKLTASGQSDVIKNLFGGKPAVVSVVTELMNGLHTYKEIKAEMSEEANIEQKMGVHLDLLIVKLKNWGATIKAITIAIGEPLVALAIPFVDKAVTGLQNTILPFIKHNQNLIKVIAKVAAVFIAFKVAGLALVTVGYLLKSTWASVRVVFLTLSVVIRVLTVAQWLLNMAIAANPLMWLIGAVVAAISVLGYFAFKTGFAARTWQRLKKALSSINLNPIKSAFKSMIDSVSNGIRYVINMINAIPEAYAKLKSIFATKASLNVTANGANISGVNSSSNNITSPFKMSLNSLSQSANHKAGITNVSYSPTIQIMGNGSPDILAKSLKDSHQDLMKLLTSGFANERRLTFQ
jgi:hypothetical protein